MNNENKKTLENILTEYENIQRQNKEKNDEMQRRFDSFINEFESFANSTIKPVMIELGNVLKARGHDYKVTFDKDYKDVKGRIIDSRITMDIFPNGEGRGNTYVDTPAHILFSADKFKEKVVLHENNIVPGTHGGGTAGLKDKIYSINDLTRQIIEQEIIESVGNILKISK